MIMKFTWHDVLVKEKQKSYFINILNTVATERKKGIIIYPPQKDIFNAFRYTKLKDVKVVILGQDPYHGPGQANGLAFSVRPSMVIPPSLMNIYKELENTITGFTRPNHGYLGSWAHQGVLLLNTILTVRAGLAYSHSDLGWKTFTDKVIMMINKHCEGVAFLLWGSHALKKQTMIESDRHYVLKASHPSPMSVHRSFWGCNHFVLVNQWLERCGKSPIDWTSVLITKDYY